MLFGVDARIPPNLLYALARMGHGDELILADRNYPAATTAANCIVNEPICLPGFNAPFAADLITSAMPLDGFAEYSALRMQIDNDPDRLAEVHVEVWDVLEPCLPKGGVLSSIERQEFYEQAQTAFAVVQTGEERPFGCFILRKGVIF